MATRPVSWHYVGEFGTPAVASFVLISEDGAKVVAIGVTASNEYIIWSADSGVLARGSYAAITTDPYDWPAGNVAASKDLSLIFIPLQSNQLLIIEDGSTTSTVDLPSGYYFTSGWVSCSSSGQYVILQIQDNANSLGFYYSDNYGGSWRLIEEYDPDTGIGYAPFSSCISDNGLYVYAPGGIGEGDNKQGYSTSGIDGISISDITELPHSPAITYNGSNIFAITTSGAFTGLFSDVVGSLTPILEGAQVYAIKSTGSTIIAGTGYTVETALVQHSTDTGASWVNGPEGIVAYDSSLAVAFNGSRLGAVETTAGQLWLTGLTSDQTGELVLAGNTPSISIDSLLTLIGYTPEITSEATDPTGVLRLIGYAPTVPIYTLTPISGTLNLTGYLPIVIRDVAYHFVRTIFFSPTYGTPEAITVTVNYDDGTLLPIYSDSGLTQPIANPFNLNLTTLTIDFYVSDLESYYNVVLTGGNLAGTVTIDEHGG